MIIVFAGTDQDAELIKFAQRDGPRVGSLTAVIRHADDDAVEDDDRHHASTSWSLSTGCASPTSLSS